MVSPLRGSGCLVALPRAHARGYSMSPPTAAGLLASSATLVPFETQRSLEAGLWADLGGMLKACPGTKPLVKGEAGRILGLEGRWTPWSSEKGFGSRQLPRRARDFAWGLERRQSGSSSTRAYALAHNGVAPTGSGCLAALPRADARGYSMSPPTAADLLAPSTDARALRRHNGT
jgi:hypothetical protein